MWRLLAQLVHEPDRRLPGGGALSLRRAGENTIGGAFFNRLAIQLMNLTSPGAALRLISPDCTVFICMPNL